MKAVSKKRQFVINAASGWVAQATFAAVGFVLMPYAIWRLGGESYGVFLLARSAVTFFMFLHLGMGPSLVRFCSQAFARHDKDKIARISSTAQLLLGGLGVTAMCACSAMIPLFISFYNIPSEIIWETQAMLLCMAATLLLHILCVAPQGLLFSASRYDIVNGTEIFYNLLRLVLVIAFFELIFPSIALFGLAMLVAALVRLVALYWLSVMAIGKEVIFSFRQVDFSSNRAMLRFSVLPFLNTISMAGIFQIPVLIVGKILGGDAVTLFAPAVLIGQVLSSFLSQTSRPLVPLASRDREENGSRNLGKWAMQFGQITAILGFGVTLLLCLFGQELLRWWLGPEFSWTWGIVTLMAAGVTMMQIQLSSDFIALGTTDIRPLVISNIIMAVVMGVGTTLCLIYGGNLQGVAILFVSCSVARNVIYLPWHYARNFQYKLKTYMGQVYMKTLLTFAGMVVFGWIAKGLSPDTVLANAIALAIVSATFIIAAWFSLLPVDIKCEIKKALLPVMQGMKI